MSNKLLIRSLILALNLTLLPTVAQAGQNRIVELNGEAQIKLKDNNQLSACGYRNDPNSRGSVAKSCEGQNNPMVI